jgi:hypothetical protein
MNAVLRIHRLGALAAILSPMRLITKHSQKPTYLLILVASHPTYKDGENYPSHPNNNLKTNKKITTPLIILIID